MYDNPLGACSTSHAIFNTYRTSLSLTVAFTSTDKYHRILRNASHLSSPGHMENGHEMALQLKIILVLNFCLVGLRAQNTVSLPEGDIIGTTMTTRKGRSISAYLGIPYAEPPIGDLRFQDPVRKTKFDSVLPGDTDGNVCPQLNDDEKLIGDEDCLFLNVYTPEATTGPQYAVMVYIHGGFWSKGSGSSKEWGPQYLLDRDVVLVTFNYRLGALGFLSTCDRAMSGNWGLKDQRLAFQWVQDNIRAFGGDPNRVTIFGQNAGAFSASMHAAAPGSAGLFNRYISQSNLPECWAWHAMRSRLAINYALVLGKKLNCKTDDSRILVKCLRAVGVYDLVNSRDIFPNEFGRLATWAPTYEHPSSVGQFGATTPILGAIDPGTRHIPCMMGEVANEGLLLTAGMSMNHTLYDVNGLYFGDFMRFVTILSLGGGNRNSQKSIRYGKMTENFYLKDIDRHDKKLLSRVFTDVATDALFTFGLFLLLGELTMDEELIAYEYSFDYRGTFSHSSLKTGNNENIGVYHGDDLIYLFPLNPKLKTSSDLEFNESDEKMIDTMVDLWTSYAITGIPETNSTSSPVDWKTWDFDVRDYLKIGDRSSTEISGHKKKRERQLAYWLDLLNNQMRDNAYGVSER